MFKGKVIAVLFLSLTLISCAASNKKQYNDDEQNQIKTAKINAQLGIAYLEQNNIQRSKQKLIKAVDQAPQIPETWYSLAYFYEATGNKKLAAQHYKKAVSIAPERGDALNNYGTFLCRSGDYEGAINQFLHAVKDNNYLDSADAYENAGICALKIPDQELAKHYFKKALAQDPSRTTAIMKMAEILYKDKDYKGAKAHLEEFLALSPPTTDSQRLSKLLLLQSTSVVATNKISSSKNTHKVRKTAKKIVKNKARHRKKIRTRRLASHYKKYKKNRKNKPVINKITAKHKKPVHQYKHKRVAKKARKKIMTKKHHYALKKKRSVKRKHLSKKRKASHLAIKKHKRASLKHVQHPRKKIKPKKTASRQNKNKVVVPLRPSPEKKYYHEHHLMAKQNSLSASMQIA